MVSYVCLSVHTYEMKYLHDELWKLAVLNEFAEVEQGGFLGVRDGGHELHDAVYDALLEL